MTAEAKMRALAKADDELQSWFGEPSGIFRWFDRQLVPGYLDIGKACVRVLRVSTVRQYAHETATQRSESRQQQPHFQIDVLDYDPERARSAATAICNWLARVDFSSDAQFASPATSPRQHPNRILNQRAGMEVTTQPPAYVEQLDVRIFNLEE